jgi:hypothetical protein
VAARTPPWSRHVLIERVRRDLWRYLTPAASIETELFEAAALLGLPPSDLRAIGGLQFLMSDELGALLEQLPFLLRRLATTTAHEEEWSADRVRGAIQWGQTFGARHATGIPHLYVTSPSRRAFQTPENELLAFMLDETVRLGRLSGWHRSTSEIAGKTVSTRVAEAERWRQARMLIQVERRPITPRLLARVRAGRFRRRYQAVLDSYDRYRSLIGILDRAAIRQSVEQHGLATRDDATLFELVCTFETLNALKNLGWNLGRLGLFQGALKLAGHRNGDRLELAYQHTPQRLSSGSIYRTTQQVHGLSVGGLRPDLVLRHLPHDGEGRWLMIEVKGGPKRDVAGSARAAAYDLLAYKTAFNTVLATTASPYGLGIAWGEGLEPAAGEPIMLCTPDTLPSALELFVG